MSEKCPKCGYSKQPKNFYENVESYCRCNLFPPAPPSPGDGPYKIVRYSPDTSISHGFEGPGIEKNMGFNFSLADCVLPLLNVAYAQGVSSMEGRLKAAEEKLKVATDALKWMCPGAYPEFADQQPVIFASSHAHWLACITKAADAMKKIAALSPGKESRT